MFGPLRCRIQGAGGESRERDERERNAKLEQKGNKTGNKNNLQKFILFVRSSDEQSTATVIHNAERVC